MTPQEQQLLEDFLAQLVEVRGVPKDPAAERLIAQAVARQPDAAYLLVQRALLVQQALEASQAEVEKLKAERGAPAAPTAAPSFLDANAWGRRATAPAAAAAPAATAATSVTGAPLSAPAMAGGAAARMAPAAAAPAARSGGFLGGGAGSFLGAAAMTAAGVAGGAFLFQGLSHLMNRDAGQAASASNTPSATPVEPLPSYDPQPVNELAATDDAGWTDDTSVDAGFDDGGDSDWV